MNIIKSFAKKTLSLILIGAFVIGLCGCRNEDGSGYIFKYTISANPDTLDPQIANDSYSELIIKNVYMGLLTANADGSVSEGVAEDYDVSSDGLVYTFRLRQDVYWVAEDFEQQCTAKDFVNGFTRLFLPETKAPRAEEYFCIKNSKAINAGAVYDTSVLGVKALSDFSLEITLEQPNPRFTQLLTEAPAMPCCEEFFLRSQGRYGLTAECTASNGAFYVKSWTYDKYASTDTNNLILRRNAKNSAARQVFPSGLNFFIEQDTAINNFLSETTSCIAVTDEQTKLIGDKYHCTAYANITTGLIFNKNYAPFKNDKFRQALSLLTNREDISNALTSFETASAIVPAQVTMLNKSYRELAQNVSTASYSIEAAQKLFDEARAEIDKSFFEGARIIVKDEFAAQSISYLMQEWQREFGFYCIVETLSESEYSARLKSGDFDAAVVDLTGSYNSPEAYFTYFSKKSASNYGGFSSTKLEALLNSAATALELSESAELYAQAEQLILDEAFFVPLYYKNEYFYTAEDCVDIIYNPFSKTVDFSIAKKF